MSKNLYIHATASKNRAAERGSPGNGHAGNGEAGIYGPVHPEDILLMSDTTAEATIAMHEQWARNWGCWNLFCKECYELVRPFYMFQLEMAQQYFSYILGMQQCVSEPVGEQKLKSEQEPGPTPGPHLVKRKEREQLAEAFDVAIGATTELWAEVVHIGPATGHASAAAA